MSRKNFQSFLAVVLCLAAFWCFGLPHPAVAEPGGAASLRAVFDFPVSLAFPEQGEYAAVFTTLIQNQAGGGDASSIPVAESGGEMVLRSFGAASQVRIIDAFREYGRTLAIRRASGAGGNDAPENGLDTVATSDPDAVFRIAPLETAGWTIRPGNGLGVQAYGVFVVGGMRFKLERIGRAVNMESYFSAWGRRFSTLADPMRPSQVFHALPVGESSDEAAFFYLYKGGMYQLTFVFPVTLQSAESLSKALPLAYGLDFSGTGAAAGACVDDFGVAREQWTSASTGECRAFLVHLSELFRRTSQLKHLGLHELRGGLPLFTDGRMGGLPGNFDRAGGQLDDVVDKLIRASGPRGGDFVPTRFLDACIGVMWCPDRVHGDRYVFLMRDRAVFFVPPYGGREAVLVDMPYARPDGEGAAVVMAGDMLVFGGERELGSPALSELLRRLFLGQEKTFASLYGCGKRPGVVDTPQPGQQKGKRAKGGTIPWT